MQADERRGRPVFEVATYGIPHALPQFDNRFRLRMNGLANRARHETALWRLLNDKNDFFDVLPPVSNMLPARGAE